MAYNVFVYGTLLEKNFILHDILETYCVNSDPAVYQGKMFCLGNIPVVIPSNDENDTVVGIVYTLDDLEILHMLDTYEGYSMYPMKNSLYIRSLVNVYTIYGEEMKAFIYLFPFNIEVPERIKDGNWLEYKKGINNGI